MSDSSSNTVQVLNFDNATTTTFSGGKHDRKRKRELSKQDIDKAYKAKERAKEDAKIKSSKFYHGDGLSLNKIRNQRLKSKLEHTEELTRFASLSALQASEILLPSVSGHIETEGMTKTWQLRQSDIIANVGEGMKKKLFDLTNLEYGPYSLDYTNNGRYMLCGGRLGHVSLFDTHTFALACEFNVNETIRAVQFLQDHTMYSVAQKNYVHIYDHDGTLLHRLSHHEEPTHLQFLPYHYLLVSGSKTGMLRYQDTSTGSIIAEHRTHKGEVCALKQNKTNAIIHCGHNNGSVTLWSPNMNKPLVSMKCHNSKILDLSVHNNGYYMCTSGTDSKLKTWDMRMWKELHEYFTYRPATSIDTSASGMTALGFGPHVQVWKDIYSEKAKSPYIYESFGGNQIGQVKFQPYEDILGVGMKNRMKNLIIPGAGEANFDTFEANPFESGKQRKERVVRSLLEKLQPDMITLDPHVFGVMNKADSEILQAEKAKQNREKLLPVVDTERKRAKGKNKSSKKALRKRKNIIDKAQMERKEEIEKRILEAKRAKELREKEAKTGVTAKSALDRFQTTM